ncbi:hypothetical protein AtNW77_Chr5g0110161 [Arabidopsis thaliana]
MYSTNPVTSQFGIASLFSISVPFMSDGFGPSSKSPFVTVTEGDGGLGGHGGGDEKKEERHDGDAFHIDGRENEMSAVTGEARSVQLGQVCR